MTHIDSPTPALTPVEARPQRELHLGWALVLISIAQLMVVLDATIANIALPYIQADLDISQANLTWVVTGYALAFGSLLLLGGRLGDLYGRRRIFMVGLVIFAVASLLGGLATNEPLLLAARGLQGLGAALAAPAALALITTTFPAGPARNRAFAVYAAMSGAGAAVGLILGGWLTGTSPEIFGFVIDGWRLTFLINVPIGIVAALLAPRFLNESESHPGELDLPGAVTGTLGLLGVVYGLSRAGSEGWGDALTIASLVAGAALMVLFIVIESRVQHPLLPFRVFLNRTRASSFVAMFLAPAAMFAMFYFLSQYIQNVMGYSPLKAGVAFLPFTVGIVFGAGLASNLVNRIDPRYIAGVGTLVAAGALYGFSTLPFDTEFPVTDVTGTYVSDLLPFIIMMAVGMGLTFVPVTLTAVHHLRSRGLRHRVGRPQHDAAGRRRARPGRAGYRRDPDLHRPRRRDRRRPGRPRRRPEARPRRPTSCRPWQLIAQHQVFTEGSTQAFLVGSILMLGASIVVWIFLNVKHEELATDGPEGVHVG